MTLQHELLASRRRQGPVTIQPLDGRPGRTLAPLTHEEEGHSIAAVIEGHREGLRHRDVRIVARYGRCMCRTVCDVPGCDSVECLDVHECTCSTTLRYVGWAKGSVSYLERDHRAVVALTAALRHRTWEQAYPGAHPSAILAVDGGGHIIRELVIP